MKIRNVLALALALLLLAALFAGCKKADDGANQPPDDSVSTTTTPPPAVEEDSPYKFAAGKFKADENGVATEAYNYELPICTTDEVLEYWNVCYTPQYIPESGFGSMPYQQELEKKTGIHIEYLCPNADAKQQNFSVLLASDSLPDLMAHGLTYYGKSAYDAISEGWFANIYDYREYCPNYLYSVRAFNDDSVYNTIYFKKDMIVWFYGLITDPTPATGYCVREDWLDKLGLNADDIDTFDEVHDMLLRFKNELGVEWPMECYYTIERTPGQSFAGYNTAGWVNPYGLPVTKVIDNKIQFTLTTQDDKDLVAMLAQWYTEGLIDPGWPSYLSNEQMSSMITNSKTGYVNMNPSQVDEFCAQTDDPDVKWTSLVRTLLYEGQKPQYGQRLTRTTYGNTTLSAKCENLPLAVTWCDWFFSPEGADYSSWGPEGVTWEYNEKGERELTDFVLANPNGIGASWALCMYAANNLCDATLFSQARSYAYEGGARLLEMSKKWIVEDYEGLYDVPSGFKLTDEESEAVSQYSGDLVTYMNETYLAFFTGSKPMSEWDDYLAGLETCGMSKILEIYQNAFEKFMAERA